MVMKEIFALLRKGVLLGMKSVKISNKIKNVLMIKYLYKKGYISIYKITKKHIEVVYKYYENNNVMKQININNNKKKSKYKIKYREIRRNYRCNKSDLIILSKYGIIDNIVAMNLKIGGNIVSKIII